MKIDIAPTKVELGLRAATDAADTLRRAIAARGRAVAIVATGASQFDTLAHFVAAEGIDWSLVTFFHLDEYVGLDATHGASFARYLRERLVEKLPQAPAAFHYLSGLGDPAAECARLKQLISQEPTIDLAMIGIGENGHLAFNDPPADFETTEPYLVVSLDEACRKQQQGEGWFPTLDDVPTHAISMSVRQILKAGNIVCSVPDERKAQAVKGSVEGPISNLVPASILQTHPSMTLYLDPPAASLLTSK